MTFYLYKCNNGLVSFEDYKMKEIEGKIAQFYGGKTGELSYFNLRTNNVLIVCKQLTQMEIEKFKEDCWK
jgi:hypothetical protein